MITTLYQEKRQYLQWWDIGIITLIMFGYFIGVSFISFFSLPDLAVADPVEFTSETNWVNLCIQLMLLALAFIYLYMRKFKFSCWNIRIHLVSMFQGIVLFIVTALLMDFYLIAASTFFPALLGNSMGEEGEIATAMEGISIFASVEPSVVIYSILNGFYEEIFFLGICLSVTSEDRYKYFFYSLFIRYSFHTYQGNVSAIGIGLLVGITYFVVYSRMKDKNLFPFFLAHTIADIFGLGIIDLIQ